jgi:hypothetical protein
VRDTCPSLLVSTAEKLGADMLPEADEPVVPEPVPLLVEPLLPEDMPELPVLLPELPVPPVLPDEVCAMAIDDSANSAAAVAVVTTFNMVDSP